MNIAAVQRRTVTVLVVGQVLIGLGTGATASIGAVLASEIAGSEAWAGAASTVSPLGAAVAGIPLARLAQRFGRRAALTLGASIAAAGSVVVVLAAAFSSLPLLLLGYAMLGFGTAVGLQARFAATDLAEPARRGRDLSLVVWSTTIGAVAGPNLFGPGELVAVALALPPLTGSFAIALVAQLAGVALYLVALRPDPLVLAGGRPVLPPSTDEPDLLGARATVVFAIATLGIAHAVMVSVMAMTPVHLLGHGADLVVVGFTISLHVAGMFAFSPLFGWAADRLGRVSTILMGQLLYAAAVLVLALGEASSALVTIGLVLLGLGWSASTVAASALVTDLVTGPSRVRMQGRADAVMNISGALGGAVAGPVLALIGYAGLAWSVGALVLAVAAGASVIGGRVRVRA